MLKYNILMAFRVLVRNRGYTGLHVLGLILGVSGGILLLSLIRFEYSYDHGFPDHQRIYRFSRYVTQGGTTRHEEQTPEPLAEYLVAEIPEIESAVRVQRLFSKAYPATIVVGNEYFQQGDGVVFSEPAVMSVFELETLYQNQDEALKQPASVVLSQSLASKLFGEEEPIGQELIVLLGDEKSFLVTGILADQPLNTSLRFEMILNVGGAYEGYGVDTNGGWGLDCCETFVKLKKGTQPKKIEDAANALLANYAANHVERFKKRLGLQSLDSIHLNVLHESGLVPSPRVRFLRAALACTLFILVIACVNFVSLTAHDHSLRARDFAIRRVLGANKIDLVLQIGAEVAILFTLAFLLSVSISASGSRLWNRFSSGYVVLPDLAATDLMLWAVIMVCLGSICTIALAIRVMPLGYSTQSGRPLSAAIRRNPARVYIVVFQLAASVTLITLSVITLKQNTYIQQFDLKFDKENILIIDVQDPEVQSHVVAMRDAIAQLSGVEAASVSSGVPGHLGWNMLLKRRSASENQVRGLALLADAAFLDLYGIASTIDVGSLPNGSILLNHVAAIQLGLEENRAEYIEAGYQFKGPLRGLLSDFRFASLKEPVRPLVLVTGNDEYIQSNLTYSFLSIKVDPIHLATILEQVERVYDSIAVSHPFYYSMLEDDLRGLYSYEEDIARLLVLFSVIAIVLSCLGFLAIVARRCAQMQHEVAIRKVLGARPIHLYWRLIKYLLVPVLIGLPLGAMMGLWVGLHELQDYNVRAPIGFSDMAFICVFVMAAVFGVTAFHLTNAIRTNPVNVLARE